MESAQDQKMAGMTLLSSPSQHNWHTYLFKRVFDVVGSACGLIVLAPFFAVVALAIRRDSPGPVFFHGPRMGKGGKVFQMVKFRTMYECPESYQGAPVTAQGDERITPLGQWLRDAKINELPQLWNVLKGDMSLVGPRPEDPEIAAAWPEEAREEILSMRPGVTCPASIAYHNEEKLLSRDHMMADYMDKILPDKLRLDRLYVRHHSFMTDLDAIFWTSVVLAPRISKFPQKEGLLFGGPFTRLARPFLNWTVIDFLTALTGATIVGLVWRMITPLNIGWPWAVVVALTMALEFGVANAVLGLPRVEWSRAAAEDIFSLFVSGGIVVLVNSVVEVFYKRITVPSGYLVASSLVIMVGFVITRYRARLLTGLASGWLGMRKSGYGVGERVLVVGAGAGGEMATWLLRRQEFQPLFDVVGYVDDDPCKQGMRYDGYTVIGTTADIPCLTSELDIGVIFYTIQKIKQYDYDRIMDVCHKTGARMVLLADVLQRIEDQITTG